MKTWHLTKGFIAIVAALFVMNSPALGQWTLSGNKVYTTNTAYHVGVGAGSTMSFYKKLEVKYTYNTSNPTYGIYVDLFNTSGSAGDVYGTYILAKSGQDGGDGDVYGTYTKATSTYENYNVFGGYFEAAGNDDNSGVYGLYVNGSYSGPSDYHYGIYGVGGKRNYFEKPVGIGTTDPGENLDVRGDVRFYNFLKGHNFTNGSACYLQYDATFQSVSNVWRFRIGGTPTAGGFALGFYAHMPNLWLKSNGSVGIGTTNPGAMLDVNGTTRTEVIQITGGSDLAEPFAITGAEAIKSGMIVSIDPEQPGQLRVSSQAYDRTVAGIISGAGGVNPGILMTGSESEAVSAYPVALTGRVYAWADASKGPIQPGDLLTISNTPGHAMKVTDYTKAQGTIIGKAMGYLEQGRGLILVLVALQ